MTTGTIAELAAAAALIVGGIWLYRRPSPQDGGHDTQGAVLLLIIGVILAIHGFGLLEYHPSPAELGQ